MAKISFNWIKRDSIYIILIIFTLGAVMYELTTLNKYQEKCNDHWKEQLQECYCPFLNPFNQTQDTILSTLQPESDSITYPSTASVHQDLNAS